MTASGPSTEEGTADNQAPAGYTKKTLTLPTIWGLSHQPSMDGNVNGERSLLLGGTINLARDLGKANQGLSAPVTGGEGNVRVVHRPTQTKADQGKPDVDTRKVAVPGVEGEADH